MTLVYSSRVLMMIGLKAVVMVTGPVAGESRGDNEVGVFHRELLCVLNGDWDGD